MCGGIFQNVVELLWMERWYCPRGSSWSRRGKKAKGQRRYTPTEAGSHQGHKTNDCQQWTNGVRCSLTPLSTSLSVWAKVKHWQVGNNNSQRHHKPIIKWPRKRLDRLRVLLQGLDNQAKHFHNQIRQMSHGEQLARKLSKVKARRQD